MAKADLNKLAKLLEKELKFNKKKDASAFRPYYSNRKTHVITINTKSIKEQSHKSMLAREGYKKPEEFKKGLETRGYSTAYSDLEKIINDEVPKFTKTMYDELWQTQKQQYKTKSPTGYRIMWDPESTALDYQFSIWKGDKGGGRGDVFQGFKADFKADAQRPFMAKLNAWNDDYSRRGKRFDEAARQEGLSEKETKRIGKTVRGAKNRKGEYREKNPRIGTKGDVVSEAVHPSGKYTAHDRFLDLGHEEGHSVSGQRKARAHELIDGFKGQTAVSTKLQKLLSDKLKITLENVTKWQGEGSKSLACSFESHALNSATMSEAKNEVDALQANLEALLEQLGEEIGGWPNAEASDSFLTMAEKKIMLGLLKPLKGSKGVRTRTRIKNIKKGKNTKTKSTPRKYKPKRTQKIQSNPSIPKLAMLIKKGKSTRSAKSKSGPANAPLFLLGIFNKELPETVRANMGEPALTNQTGRFAGSVRATDMVQTPQGFPSIGYTYQRDPYGTFEQDVNYDPRKLIDRSMREIAAEYAIGRFYTRRV